MPRQPRLLIENVCYHVICRGNQRQAVFLTDDDHSKYIMLLRHYKRKHRARLYAFCLMTNHVHLIVDCLKLTKLMHGINLSYAKYFNKKHNKVGHLWQDRFKSLVITKDKYLLDCLQYIEYNPVRARIVDNPANFQWSSYRNRILGQISDTLDQIEL